MSTRELDAICEALRLLGDAAGSAEPLGSIAEDALRTARSMRGRAVEGYYGPDFRERYGTVFTRERYVGDRPALLIPDAATDPQGEGA